nr:SDR family oxidoreductase [Paenibacillus azoreducens]
MAVAPGPTNTELFTVGKTPEQIQGLANMNAFGCLGETEDTAGVILFLASEESQWVTGTNHPCEWWIHLGRV